MKANQIQWSRANLLGIASAILLPTLSAVASDVTWNGLSPNGANWSDPNNWAGTVAPTNGDNLIFSDSTQQQNANDIAGLSLGWLRFANGDFALSGNALTLSSGLTNEGGNDFLSTPVTLGAAQNFESAAGSSFSLSNTLSLGTSALSVTGDGDVTLAGVVSGTGSVVKNGTGALTLAAANTYSGGLTVNAGTLNSRTANGTTYGSVGNGSLVINSGAAVTALGDNSLFGQGATLAPPRSATLNAGGTLTTDSRTCHTVPLILNGGTLSGATANATWGNWNLDYGVSTLTNGSTSLIDAGNVTLGQTGGTVFNIGAGDTVNVSSVIAHTTSAADLGLIKSGAGVLALSAENTYTSATVINAGTLALTGSGSILKSPTITIASNAVLDVSQGYLSIGTNQTLAGVGTVFGTINDSDPGATGSTLSPGGLSTGTLTVDSLNLSGNSLALNFNLGNR